MVCSAVHPHPPTPRRGTLTSSLARQHPGDPLLGALSGGDGGGPFPDPGSLSAPAHTGLLRRDPGRRHPESKQQRPPCPAPRARGHLPGEGAQRSPSSGLGTGRAGTGRRGATGWSSSSCVWGGVPVRVPLRGGHTFLRPPRPSQVCSHHQNILGAPPAAFCSLFLQRPPQPVTSTPAAREHTCPGRVPLGVPRPLSPRWHPKTHPSSAGLGHHQQPASALLPSGPAGCLSTPPPHHPRSSQAVPVPMWAQAVHPREPCPPMEGFAQSIWGSRARPQLGPRSFLQGVTKQ